MPSVPAEPAASTGPQLKRRVHHFSALHQRHQSIVMVTAHDYPSALAADQAGVDAILVGDSLGMTVLGFESTISVTLDMMIHHCAAVKRGTRQAFLVADLPFLSYQISPAQALTNAGRLLQEGGAEAVKMEGGAHFASTVEAVVRAGIPVMGHIGLLPQSVHRHGGYRIQGRREEERLRLVEDALALEQAGAFALVLEAMDTQLAREITDKLTIPTIGIGAGRGCSGQVLVQADLLGYGPLPPPKFAQPYASLLESTIHAISQYAEDVRSGRFPEEKHEY